jgi:hypothetical protein
LTPALPEPDDEEDPENGMDRKLDDFPDVLAVVRVHLDCTTA